MPSSTEDQDYILIQSYILKKDQDSFRLLMEKYQDQVHNYCCRFFGNDWDAKDCGQEVFIRVFQNLAKFQFKAKFSSWIYRITINACNEMVRSKSYRQSLKTGELKSSIVESVTDTHGGKSTSSNPEMALYRKQVNAAFQEALDKLNPKHRSLIILRDIDGHSYDEMAKITGMKIGTVRSTLARARYKMAEQLKQFRNAM